MPVIAPIVYPYFGEGFGTLFKINEQKAKDESRKWLMSLKTIIPERFDELGYNSITINTLDYGVSCFASSRKYPNLYTTFTISEEKTTPMVEWKYYISENRWCTFEVSMLQMMSVLELTAKRSSKKHWWSRREEHSIMTNDMFNEAIEQLFHANRVSPKPYKFHYGYGGLDIYLDKNKDIFGGKDEGYFFENIGGRIVKNLITLDNTQQKLLFMFNNDIVGDLPKKFS